ncbi:MAG: FG-GAP-like repeat-containing protein [Candidatus Njordarchaeia archaeon]
MKKIYPILFLLLVSVFTIPYLAKSNQSKEFQIKEVALLWSSPEYSSEPLGLNVADLYHNGSFEVLFHSGGTIYCLNGRNGSFIWKYQTNKDVWGLIAIGDLNGDNISDIVVGARMDKYVFAINGINGNLLWRSGRFESNISTYPALCDVDGDNRVDVLIGDSGGTFYALNGSDGGILWKYEINGSIKMRGPPAVGDLDNDGKNEVIFFGGDGYAYALNGEDGSLLWRFRAGQQVLSSAALADVDDDGRLEVIFGVIGSQEYKYGYVYALNGEDGSLLWRRRIEKENEFFFEVGPSFSSPALGDIDSDGKLEIILGSSLRRIFALNGEDGSILWQYYAGSLWNWHSPAIGDIDGDNQLDVLHVGRYDLYSMFYAIDGKSGKLIWKSSLRIDCTWWRVVLADLDKDNKLELITANIDPQVNRIFVYKILGSGFRVYWPKECGNDMRTNDLKTLDHDLDGLSDMSERYVGTDPRDWDTDSDRMPDGWEVAYGLNATNPIDAGLDPDNDTLTNLEEYHLGTDPLCVDTDGDGIPDENDDHPTVYDKSLAEYLGEVATGIGRFLIANLTDLLLTISIGILVVIFYTEQRKKKR